MSTYETTVKISHISTSGKARNGLSVADAVGSAKAHLRYITRDDAAEDGNIIARTDGQFLDGTTDDLKTAARQAIDARSQKHTDAYGVRLTDKLMVSLPNDATIAEQRQMCANILEDFTADSEALGLAAIHTDKAGNAHAHFLFVDGLETREAAKARRPDAKRVRRADALRLNEGGNRQEVRASVATSINAVAELSGRRLAEVQSFKERGVAARAQRHEGVQVQDKRRRGEGEQIRLTPPVRRRLALNNLHFKDKIRSSPKGTRASEVLPERHTRGPLAKKWSAFIARMKEERKARKARQAALAAEAPAPLAQPSQPATRPQKPAQPPQPATRPQKPAQPPQRPTTTTREERQEERRANIKARARRRRDDAER